MNEQVKRDLQNAATLLREMGWCQGAFHSGDKSCAAGAIIWATKDYPAGEAALRALRRHLQTDLGGVGRWNDTPGRTAEEVISALEAASESIR